MTGNPTDITKNKLNILYFLDRISEPVLELTIEKAMIENEFMNYFSFKTYINELEEEGFVRAIQIIDKSHYEILDRGRETLNYFNDLILGSEKEVLSKYIDKNINDICKSKEMMIDYKKTGNSKYQVDVNLLEKENSYFRLTLEVPSKESVDKIIGNWTNNSSDVYVEIMNLLFKEKRSN